MQKYIVEQLLSSLHARALLHAVGVEPFGSQTDFILLNIFMSVKTQNIFSYTFNGDNGIYIYLRKYRS